MHSGGLELTKLTYTRLEDNLIRLRGDRLVIYVVGDSPVIATWGSIVRVPEVKVLTRN